MLSKAVLEAREQGYVTANELAELCGVHRTTVSLAIRHGRLKSTRVGNVSLVSRKDADDFSSQYNITQTSSKKPTKNTRT